jgi:hypothetical protein
MTVLIRILIRIRIGVTAVMTKTAVLTAVMTKTAILTAVMTKTAVLTAVMTAIVLTAVITVTLNGHCPVHGFTCHGETEYVGRTLRTCERKTTCDSRVLLSASCNVACDGEEAIT